MFAQLNCAKIKRRFVADIYSMITSVYQNSSSQKDIIEISYNISEKKKLFQICKYISSNLISVLISFIFSSFFLYIHHATLYHQFQIYNN